MKTEEIKIFTGTKEIIEHYSFVSNEKKDEVGHKHFWVPLEHQLKWFNNGLGAITYFETKENENPKIKGDGDLQSKFLYQIHIEYVKNLEMGNVLEDKTSYLKADGFDDCFMGVGFSFGRHGVLVYDETKVIENLVKQGMTEEEAYEYYEYNILGACLGDNMPIFMRQCSMNEIEELLNPEEPQNNDS
jgi:hypothetical protein